MLISTRAYVNRGVASRNNFGSLWPSICTPKQLLRHFSKVSSNKPNESTCRIGCSSGFWGDTAVAATQLVNKCDIQFLVADYLSEITMSLLAAMKTKNPNLGYVPDFIQSGIGPCLKNIHKKGIRVVTNAGGMNVHACADAVRKLASDLNWPDVRVAAVCGDDLLKSATSQSNTTQSLNAYLGAGAIKAALDHEADIVITGRCVDSALVLGPLMHTFNWGPEELDKLATGSLAGHLVECGAQVTGGIFTDHASVPDWWNIGFPIVECDKDGREFIVTKPSGTGGLVSRGTVCEQLLYEIHDPAAYQLPDVICDFTDVSVEQVAPDRVRVAGARGYAPQSWQYKVTGTRLDGYRLTTGAIVIGQQAAHKARRTAEEILKRVRAILQHMKLPDFRRVHVQVIGAEESYAPTFRMSAEKVSEVREVVLWLAAEHENRTALELLAREVAPAGTGMAPGLTTLIGHGRPKVSPIFRMETTFVPSAQVPVSVNINGTEVCTVEPPGTRVTADAASRPQPTASQSSSESTLSTKRSSNSRLSELAWLRSGDKGDTCNIGVVARRKEDWSFLRATLTEKVVGEFFRTHFPQEQWEGRVTRYELDGVQALNFVLKEVLGGGGVSSLRPDPQGKAFAQMLADLRL